MAQGIVIVYTFQACQDALTLSLPHARKLFLFMDAFGIHTRRVHTLGFQNRALNFGQLSFRQTKSEMLEI